MERKYTLEEDKNGKLKLRYDKLQTKYKHFSVLADGRAEEPIDDFGCPVGPAWMSMKAWASSADESIKMIRFIGCQIGFKVIGEVQTCASEPEDPPQEKPYGYNISFSPYLEE